jgi:hypothetical protein
VLGVNHMVKTVITILYGNKNMGVSLHKNIWLQTACHILSKL